jgi:hypothetical protein
LFSTFANRVLGPLKLYVCYGTFKTPRPGGHPCANAHEALREAGWDPELVKSYGFGLLPDFLNATSGRREVKELTGNNWVPVLVTDDGEVVQDSKRIVQWAKANPAPPAYKQP